ncbi:dienelactone hydrolase family protein [Novosphingobium sp. PY1]|uniref:dienelactone hydrolase family protein n=1 Tax=Novosphingobium sp. PY1 TaxID=1882221 RepID=UPI001A8EB143|nr:dienelactone hydrolase family protein [Novosphingobium sp. PY1]GFM27251.1 carboxymethylenebutenolidase [Novosphingobium sp. PY1]
MCDEFTQASEDANLARRGLSRRQFAAMGATIALASCSKSVEADGGSQVAERMVSITTPDGVADAFFVHPSEGAHPGIVMWPDIAGLREAKKIMARTLAAEGYAVLVVNQYYRGGPAPLLKSFAEWRTPEGQAKIAPLREQLTPAAITSDAGAYVAFLDGQREVDKGRRIGSNGYCMGGPFTVRTAAAVPDRVGAAASLHGGGLVTEEPDSPHRLLAKTEASYLFAIARNDDARDPQAKVELRKAADAAGRPAEIEVYQADHGWCVPDSPSWDPSEADKAWNRMLALFARL